MLRVSYRLAHGKRSHLNFVESPPAQNHGWEPVSCNEPILPERLMDLIANDEDDKSDEDEDENDVHLEESDSNHE